MFRVWQWWYLRGLGSAFSWLLNLLRRQAEGFSVKVLLRTLFSPWKQTVNIPGPNTPLQVRLQWWIGNQISRFLGFLIRSITLLIALVALSVTTVLGMSLLLAWYFIPLASVVFLILGLAGIWR